MSCERCRRGGHAAYSSRLDQTVCWGCYHGSFPAAEATDAERVDRQGKIARAIRGALRDLDHGERRRALSARAFLIEVADSVDEVLELLHEVEALGVEVERNPS